MRKRLVFQCWNCRREYGLTLAVPGAPQLIVECPFCGQEGVVDLAPYRSPIQEVYRSGDSPEEGEVSLVLPAVLPTRPVEAAS